MDYFQCESTARGNQSCSRSKFERANVSLYALALAQVSIDIYPLVLLMYMTGDPKELGKVCLQLPQKLKMVRTANGSLSLTRLQDGRHVGSLVKNHARHQVESQMRGEESNGEKYQHGYVEWSNHVRMEEQDDQAREQDQSCRDNGMQVESGL